MILFFRLRDNGEAYRHSSIVFVFFLNKNTQKNETEFCSKRRKGKFDEFKRDDEIHTFERFRIFHFIVIFT